jgi:hypothetical protein
MDVKIRAKSSFTHSRFNLAKNQECLMPEAMAKDLEKAGLVEMAGDKPAASAAKTTKTAASKAAPRGNKGASAAADPAANAALPAQPTEPANDTDAPAASADVCTTNPT